ncbi:MAG TPA: alpha/beta hydrolase [Dongiaceae bacterium]|nr:alpha/beta hydrolase [Dongiaceae bacterium]
MAFATVDGIETRYELVGEGPPLLMHAPGGFDATIEKWSSLGIYKELGFLDHLTKHYRCILFDRRECGRSGGRVEAVTWSHYARHGKGLLEHLGIEKAHHMGGCMGCSVAIAIAAAYPQAMLGMILFWPVGGAKYRITGQRRFAEHLAFVEQNGLPAVVTLGRQSDKSFSADPRGGPWVSVIRNDPVFADRYAALDLEPYKSIVIGMKQALLDRDTAPGAEPEDLMRLSVPTLVVPGSDPSHATSAARYLEECIPGSQYWDMPVAQQTSDATNARVLAFLRNSAAG